MKRMQTLWIPLALGCCLLLTAGTTAEANDKESKQTHNYDVVVYGGTSGGIAAAVQVARMKKSVVVIEPSKHLGGLSSGGLGATDIGNKAAIGGISREFYQRLKHHYTAGPDKPFTLIEIKDGNAQDLKDDAQWTFEPHVAEKIFNDLVKEEKIKVYLQERLDLKEGVTKEKNRIVRIKMESGLVFQGKRFIDATYEGDLMALSGVSYHVGREANSVYGETLNGVETKHARSHQLEKGIDPYVVPKDPTSGLLPGIDPSGPGKEGSGDKRVQAYNFRMCETNVAKNRIPWTKPAGYDPQLYELLLRNFEAAKKNGSRYRLPFLVRRMPNGKTDSNNSQGFSTDFIGQNYDYPEGDYKTRERIIQEHLRYQQGLMWTLANNPRVPEQIRQRCQEYGNCKDEFQETGGWPHQIYVREARRMISDYVMTQHNCQGREVVEDSVGLAAYTMDSHHTQRYITKEGYVQNEGDVQVGGFSPYAISYRSIVPKHKECANLFVPVCLSASHIAFGSIRMEPVFMVLGQSAATAACHSIDANVDVQNVDVKKLQTRLLADHLVLRWHGPVKQSQFYLPDSFQGIVIDGKDVKLQGQWLKSNSSPGYVGRYYSHDDNQGKGSKSARFEAKLPAAGKYEVLLSYPANPNRATNVPVTIRHAGGATTRKVNQRATKNKESVFFPLGVFSFEKTTPGIVIVETADTDGHVIADAVLFRKAK